MRARSRRSGKGAEPEAEAEAAARSALGTPGGMAEPAPAPPAELSLRRRLPPRLPRRRGDVYVNMQTDFRAQLSRCQKLLGPGGGCAEICIHGLGLAVPRAVNIALQLAAGGAGALRLEANTSTVPLADAPAPPAPDARPPPARARNNSAIHIRVRRAPAP